MSERRENNSNILSQIKWLQVCGLTDRQSDSYEGYVFMYPSLYFSERLSEYYSTLVYLLRLYLE